MTPLNEGKKGLLPNGFLEIPTLIYGNDPLWIPEDSLAVTNSFSPHNPWFEQGLAKTWCIPGKVRAAAFHDPKARIQDRKAVFFGYWETMPEEEESNLQLFQAIKEWTRSLGAKDIYGPINFTTFGPYRLRLTAEEKAIPFPGEPYNHPYYPELMSKMGFQLQQKYITQVFSPAQQQIGYKHFLPIQEKLINQGFVFSPLGQDLWMENLAELHLLVDSIFADNFAYTPISYQSFIKACGQSFIRKACPQTSMMVFAPDNSIAGFFLCYPHYGPITNLGAGNSRVKMSDLEYEKHIPWLRQDKKKPDMVAKTVGVDNKYRRLGVMQGLSAAVLQGGAGRWNRWYGALIREDNPSLRPGKSHTLYQREYGLYQLVS